MSAAVLLGIGLVACVSPSPPPAVDETGTGETGGDTGAALPAIVAVIAGIPGVAGRGSEGVSPTAGPLYLPQDVTATGPVWWIADYNNHVIREVVDGTIQTIAGSGFPAGGDAGPALTVPLDHPNQAIADPSDPTLLWIAATGNHRIARLDRSTGWLDFPAGTGAAAFAGDGGPASEGAFWRPSSLAFDDAGALYVSDRMNQVVRRIAPDGTLSTVAGTPGVAGYAGDGGPATEALLNAPAYTETDPGNRLTWHGGRLYLADSGNGAVRVVDLATGTIDTLAAGFVDPHDVAVGEDGTVYVVDTGAHCVWALPPDGPATGVVGLCGTPGPAVDGVSVADARLDTPAGIAVDGGWLYVADTRNHVIRRLPRTAGTGATR